MAGKAREQLAVWREIGRQVVGREGTGGTDSPGDDSDTAGHHNSQGLNNLSNLIIQYNPIKELCQTVRLTLRSASDVMASSG